MVPLTGLEPVLWKPERDFKSRVSTNSTIAAYSIPPMEGYEVGGMCWRDVPTQRKIKLKKLAVCKHNSDWVLDSAQRILSPLCLPIPPQRRSIIIPQLFSAVKLIVGQDSGQRRPGSCPETSQAPDAPWLSWRPRSVSRLCQTPCCPLSAPPGT